MNQLSRKPVGIRRRESIRRWSLNGLIGMAFWGTVILVSTAGATAQNATNLENPACTQDAHVITVPGGDVAALIAALNAANSHTEGTLINLEAGVYTLTAVDNTSGGDNNGLPAIISPICIQGAGADTTLIERASANEFRLFYVASGGVLTLNAVTLQGGFLWGGDGGGLFNDQGGRVIISNGIITGSVVVGGGGGGIFNRGTMRITQSTLSGNAQADGIGGGGIYNAAEMAISQSSIVGNGSPEDSGGGIFNTGNMTLAQSTIANNRGTVFGGGIANFGNLTITNSTVANNRVRGFGSFASGVGGGISNWGELRIIQSTLSGNQALDSVEDGNVLLLGQGGGIANSGSGTVTLQNTLLAGNTATEGPDCFGSITSPGHNLLGDLTGCTVSLGTGDLTGDPGLGPFQDPGAPGEGHFPLLATSQAIDAGANEVCPPIDQVGTPRPVDGNGDGTARCDIGAIEFSPASLPTSRTTVGLYDPTEGRFRLRTEHAGGRADYNFRFGPLASSRLPVAGDWNGNGQETIGLYDPNQGQFYLNDHLAWRRADYRFRFGPQAADWIPLAGDWNGDGITTVGLYNPTQSKFFLRNSHTRGPADTTFRFGPGGFGWQPLAGDWDGDGRTTIGLYDPVTSRFYLRNRLAGGAADISFRFGMGNQGQVPLAGDWDGDGVETVGLYDPATSRFYLNNRHAGGAADLRFRFGRGGVGWLPVTGQWVEP